MWGSWEFGYLQPIHGVQAHATTENEKRTAENAITQQTKAQWKLGVPMVARDGGEAGGIPLCGKIFPPKIDSDRDHVSEACNSAQ